jgi:hypothetical protein
VYRGLDAYLLNRVPPTQQEVAFTFPEIAAFLAVLGSLSARTLEERFEVLHARQHWRQLGFTVRVDWLERRVVFTRPDAQSGVRRP